MPTDPLTVWSQRVLLDDEQPEWKILVATRVLGRNWQPQRTQARVTAYSDDHRLDPVCGGGKWGCSWAGGGDGILLRWGHIATYRAHRNNSPWPTGTVLFVPALRRSMVVVDTGPGVHRGQIDVYCPTAREWASVGRIGEHTTVQRLCRITRAQARQR